jgi:hypothetical protein
LDNKFDRAAMIIKEGQGEKVAEQVQKFIKSLNPELDPKAIFHSNYSAFVFLKRIILLLLL